MAYQTQHCINSLTYHQRINYILTYDYIFKKNLLKSSDSMTVMWLSIIGMWFCIGMAFFAIKVIKNKN